MFEEMYRNKGTILNADGSRHNEKCYKELSVLYFVLEGNFRDQDGVLQLDTTIFCKAPDLISPLLNVSADSKFIDAMGEEYELQTVTNVFDHFNNVFECVKLVVKQ